MKVYQLKRTQVLPISMDQAWEFLSTPSNLEQITPPDMKFEILSDLEGGMYAGQIINYFVQPFPGIKMRWTTEISHCIEGQYFVDEQRFGPYAFWHHKHFIEAAAGGVKMIDVVDYALPFGFIGRLAHRLFVRRKLKQIFDFRFKWLEQCFQPDTDKVRLS